MGTPLIASIAHVNVTVPKGKESLAQAKAFYSDLLGFEPAAVPATNKETSSWFNIGKSGQQVHVSVDDAVDQASRRHPCFKLSSEDALKQLRQKLWDAKKAGAMGAPMDCDEPGKTNSGSQSAEYAPRFFARDFAGNRIEFSA